MDQAGIFGRKANTFVSLFLFLSPRRLRTTHDRVQRSKPCTVLYRVYGNVPDVASESLWKLHISQILGQLQYRNIPKFSDRQVWANSADPDQAAPRGGL